MEVSVSVGPVTVLAVKGDVDSNTFHQLVEEAETVLRQGYVNLVLDLQGVNYISSGGLVAIQTIVGHAANHKGKAVLSGATNRVAQVLDMTGFTKFLSIFPDLAAAKASFPQA